MAAAGLYALGAVYWFVLLLSPPGWQGLPGEPAWAVAPDTLSEVIAESTDFFFILPLLNKFGFNLLGAAPQVHPVTLGVFNFAEAFVFMLLPPLLMDRKGRDLPTVKLWSAAMFLTNALLLPTANRTATPVPARGNQKVPARRRSRPTMEEGSAVQGVRRLGLAVGLPPWVGAGCDLPWAVTCRNVGLLAQLTSIVCRWHSPWTSRCSRAGRRAIGELDPEAPAACKFVPFWGLAACSCCRIYYVLRR